MRQAIPENLSTGGLRDRAPQSRFEVFLFSAVATVLITRAYLAATGYPQVSGGTLHVAHVVWGGLLLGIAIVSMAIVPGSRVKMRGALIGGIGFGLFIDEVGKFLTKDVDYFFQPAVAVMYVVFVGFYLVVVMVLRRRRPTDQLRLATGLDALTDQTLGQLTQSRRELAVTMLDDIADPAMAAVAAEVGAALRADLGEDHGFGYRMTMWRDAVGRRVRRLLAGKAARRIVIGIFIIEALATVADVIQVLVRQRIVIDGVAELGSVLSGLVISAMIIVGVWFLARNRYLRALRILRAAVVIDLLVNQVFNFAAEQFGALIGFGLALVMLAVLRSAIRTEELAEEKAAIAAAAAAEPAPA